MGKVTKHVEGRTKDQRAKVRKNLGSLKQLTVQPKTRARYEAARAKFYKFLADEHLQLPRKRDDLDAVLAEYIDWLWLTGEGRGLASDTVAGLQDMDPKLKGHPAQTWRLLKTWHINEIPNRAPPLPEVALFALLGWSIFHRHHDFALSLMLGVYGLLRTGETFAVTSSAVLITGPSKPAVISLGLTKGGKRTGASESITVHVEELLRRLWHWKKHATARQFLVPSGSKWRSLFNLCLQELKLDQFGFRPYSLRRGGSTFWFQKHTSFDKLLVMGRWQASRTARIYLNEGLAMIAELKMPVNSLRLFTTVYRNSLSAPLPKLERTLRVGQGDLEGSWGVIFKHRFPKVFFKEKCLRLEFSSVWRETQETSRVPYLFFRKWRM